jgi:hypothetical protein
MKERDMMSETSTTPWYRRLLTGLVAAVLLWASALPFYVASKQCGFLSDDTYITLTYAKNIALGNGFSFNGAPATLGTTSPLLALVIGALAALLPNVPVDAIAVYFSAACWTGIVWLFFLFRKIWNLEDWQAGIVGIAVIATVGVACMGMESYLFSFLLVACLTLFFGNRHLFAGFAAGLLFLTRGEGILVFLLLAASKMVEDWRERKVLDVQTAKTALPLGLGFAVPFLIWLVYALSTFGAILPNTLAAKQAQKQTQIWQPFYREMIRQWLPNWGSLFDVSPLPRRVAWWLLIALGALSFRRQRPWQAIGLWITLYVVGYSLLGVAAYPWYQLPILFVLHLFLALGVIRCICFLQRRIRFAPIMFVLSLAVVWFFAYALASPTLYMAKMYKGDPRAESYMAVSQWLREHTTGDQSVASIEVGYLGYYTDNRIIDLAGLVLPDIVPHIAKKDFTWGFWHYMPDYYLYMTEFDFVLGDIKNNPQFDRSYAPVAAIPRPKVADIVIYKRIVK